MFCGFPLGAVGGAILSAALMPDYGWRSVFLFGGCLPLLMLPLILRALPESIRWLSAAGRVQQRERILAKLGASYVDAGAVTLEGHDATKASVFNLFTGGRAPATLFLWSIFFFSLLLVFLLVSWVPALAVKAGHSASSGAVAAALLNLGGIVGSVAFGRVADRRGSYGVVAAAYLVGAAGFLLIGIGDGARASIFVFSACAGLFCIGAQMCTVAIAAHLYPSSLRATGIGWAIGVGRIGAVAGPLIGGAVIGDQGVSLRLPLLLAAAAILSGGGVAALSWSTRALRKRNAAHA
jgi:AAHS family 4-hydroxybenzoate transporter-like MFS transporter